MLLQAWRKNDCPFENSKTQNLSKSDSKAFCIENISVPASYDILKELQYLVFQMLKCHPALYWIPNQVNRWLQRLQRQEVSYEQGTALPVVKLRVICCSGPKSGRHKLLDIRNIQVVRINRQRVQQAVWWCKHKSPWQKKLCWTHLNSMFIFRTQQQWFVFREQVWILTLEVVRDFHHSSLSGGIRPVGLVSFFMVSAGVS